MATKRVKKEEAVNLTSQPAVGTRLFEVNGEYFNCKADASRARGAATTPAEGNKPAKYAHEIHKGPDNHAFGVKGNPKTHSHNARSGGPGTGFPRGKR